MATGKLKKPISWSEREVTNGSPVTYGQWTLTTDEINSAILFVSVFRYGYHNFAVISPTRTNANSENTMPGQQNIKYSYDTTTHVFTLVSAPSACFVSFTRIG